MTSFLFTKQNIFNLGASPEFYMLGGMDDQFHQVNPDAFNQKDRNLVSFDIEKIIEALRESNQHLKATIIDVSQIFRIVIGKPAKELQYSDPFSFDKILLHFKIYSIEKIDVISKGINTDTELLSNDQILDILNGLKKVFDLLVKDAQRLNELNRFINIELPVCQLLYEREIKGIRVSAEKLQNRLSKLDELEYLSQNKLRYDYGVLDGNDNDSVYPALEENNLTFIAENLNSNSIEHLFKVGSETNELISLIYNFRKAKRDKFFLFRFNVIGNERIYPIYDCIGTITSRILIKDPLIQQLRKSSRDIFIPDINKEFIYADFGQFEPGILADKSKDKNLIKLYNEGDVYEGLSLNIFGTKSYRKFAKILFLSYMYGMSIDRLSLTINDMFPGKIKDVSEKLEIFFAEFISLVSYKGKLEDELLNNNRIGTSCGNFRNRESIGSINLKDQEKRWLLSQKIQGTASLILKRAILDLQKFKSIEFLIPMHDAVLFQVPCNEVEEHTMLINNAFSNAFVSECPLIAPKVNFEQFYE